MGTLTARGQRILEDMRVVNATRGLNGCGVAYINAQQHIHVIKGMVTPQELIMNNKYQKAVKRKNIACIAHSRAATVGSLTEQFTHPYKFKNVTGVHNGTIQEHGRKYLYEHEKYESDSENIFATIEKHGIRKAWSHIDGAAALAFWDKREKGLCLIRNAQRPLFFAFLDEEGEVDEGAAMVFASEPWMISGCCDRNNVNHSTIWNPPPDALFTFKYNSKTSTVTYKAEVLEPFKWADHLKVKPYKAPLPFTRPHIVLDAKNDKLDGWDEDDLGDYGWWANGFGRKPMLLAPPASGDAYEEIRAKSIKPAEFYKTYKKCVQCDEDLFGTFQMSVIIDDKSAMCPKCATQGLNTEPINQVPWRH